MLNVQQIQQVRQMLQTSGWNDVLKPFALGRGRELTKIALRLPANRPEPYKGMDDRDAMNHIRGRIEEIEWLMSFFENEINVSDFNRRKDELERQTNGIGSNEAQLPA